VLIAICSAKGSPGVTTTALAMALEWPTPVVLAECDPAGADVLAGYGGGKVAASSGLADLMVTLRHGTGERDLWSHLVALGEQRRAFLLPGVTDARAARAIDWPRLASVLRGVSPGADVIADCGRLRAEHIPRPVLAAADVVVVVSGWHLRSLRQAQALLAELRADLASRGAGADGLGVLLVGSRSAYGEAEVTAQLGVPVLGVIPDDPRTAQVLSDGTPAGRGFAQSPLLRAARGVVEQVGVFARRRSDRLGTAAVATSQVEPPAWKAGPTRPPAAAGRVLHAVAPPQQPTSHVAEEAPPREPVRREPKRWAEPRPMRSPGDARHG